MHDLVVRGGLVVSPAGMVRADVSVLNGRITAVGGVAGPARRTIDATGLHVLPGGVEPHMHVENDFLGLSTAHDFYTQSVAAAHGGVTTFFDFANTPAGGSLPEACAVRREQMAKSAIDFAVHGRVQEEAHLAGLAEAVAAGCPSFKLYMTYPEVGLMADDRTLLAAFRASREAGALPLIHAESEPIAAALTAEARREGDLLGALSRDATPALRGRGLRPRGPLRSPRREPALRGPHLRRRGRGRGPAREAGGPPTVRRDLPAIPRPRPPPLRRPRPGRARGLRAAAAGPAGGAGPLAGARRRDD